MEKKKEMRVKSALHMMSSEHMRILSYRIGRRFEKPNA